MRIASAVGSTLDDSRRCGSFCCLVRKGNTAWFVASGLRSGQAVVDAATMRGVGNGSGFLEVDAHGTRSGFLEVDAPDTGSGFLEVGARKQRASIYLQFFGPLSVYNMFSNLIAAVFAPVAFVSY